MGKEGFIFSLDAFVAFTLIMMTIGLLIFTIGTPKPYYPSLEQTHQLAHDTLRVLATSSDSPSNPTYLEQIIGRSGLPVNEIMYRVAGGRETSAEGGGVRYRPIIPKGYGFRLETYEFGAFPSEKQRWVVLYDSSEDVLSDRYGKKFSKVQASATAFGSIYAVAPFQGKSPFCYLSCNGFDPSNPPSYNLVPCNATPCDFPISNFMAGKNTIQLVRFVVYA
ncbi:MAG: hypothetical protein N3E51_01120 [Candidatus Micrarchaeota archaeon]|nr:hypothetical protein [Candidatus Micrarchaeota archaeon]